VAAKNFPHPKENKAVKRMLRLLKIKNVVFSFLTYALKRRMRDGWVYGYGSGVGVGVALVLVAWTRVSVKYEP
jgi:Na+-transporting NADH:ubiquinone oxidoreductase subunit NqrE